MMMFSPPRVGAAVAPPRVALAARRALSAKPDAAPLVGRTLSASGILTLRFQNEKKLNAWTMPLMKQAFGALAEAATDDAVKGVVVTGSGKYYSAGVDLSSMIQPMAPSKLVRQIRDQNEQCFRSFLDFPKPIVAAVNGPAIGAAVTSAILMDRVLALPDASSFSLPFAKLGVPPEGCSSVTFPERMGAEAAERMLGAENWIPTGQQALDAGLIDEVVDGDADALVARAVDVVTELVAAGGGRRFDATELDRLLKVNALESATLANAFVSPKFLGAMQDFNTRRKKSQLASFFWLAKASLPVWQPAKIAPSMS